MHMRFMAGLVRRVGYSLANLASGGLNLLFPPRCAYCHADIDVMTRKIICRFVAECCRRLVPEKWIGCRHCGGAIPDESWQLGDHCSMCKNRPLLFDTVVTMGGYQAIFAM